MVDIIPDGQGLWGGPRTLIEEPESTASEAYQKIPPTTGTAMGALFGDQTAPLLMQHIERGQFTDSSWLNRFLSDLGAGLREEAPPGFDAGYMVGPAAKPIETPTIDADEANRLYAAPGHKITDKPISQGLAQVLGRQQAENLQRKGAIDRWMNAHSLPAAVGLDALTQLADPLMLATGFIPVLGEEAIAGRLATNVFGRTAARVGAGALTGAAAQAPLALARLGISQDEIDDYDLRHALLDVAGGAAGMAVLHAGVIGPVSDFLRWRRGAPLPANVDPRLAETAAPVVDADAATNRAALTAAIGQVAEGRQVDVEPMFNAEGEYIGPRPRPDLRTPEPIEGFQFLAPATFARKQSEALSEGYAPGLSRDEFAAAKAAVDNAPKPAPADEAIPPQQRTFRTEIEINGEKTVIEGPTEALRPPTRASELEAPVIEGELGKALQEEEATFAALSEDQKSGLLPEEHAELEQTRAALDEADQKGAAYDAAAQCLKGLL